MVHNTQLPWSILASSLTYDNEHHNDIYPDDVSEHEEAIEDFAAVFQRSIREEIEESKNETVATNQEHIIPNNAAPHGTARPNASNAVELGLASLDKALFDKVTTDRRKLGRFVTEPRILHKVALESVQKHIIHNEMQPLFEAAIDNAPNLRFLWNIPNWTFHFFGPGWSEVMRLALMSYMCLTVFDLKYEENPSLSFNYLKTRTYRELLAHVTFSYSNIAAEPHRAFYRVPRQRRLSLNGHEVFVPGVGPLHVYKLEPPPSIYFYSSSDTQIVDEEGSIQLPDNPFNPLIETNREQLEHYLQYCWSLLKRCDMVAGALGKKINWKSEVAQCARQLWGGKDEISDAIDEKREPLETLAKPIQEEVREVQDSRRAFQDKKYSNVRRVNRVHNELKALQRKYRAGEGWRVDPQVRHAKVEKLKEKLDALSERGEELEAKEERLMESTKEEIRDLTQSLNDLLAERNEHGTCLGPSFLFHDSTLSH